MRCSTRDEPSRYSEGTQYFTGYNHCLRNDASEMYDAHNMTMDEYPFLASRHSRGLVNLSDGKTAKNMLVADVAMGGIIYPSALIVQTENSIEVYDSSYNHLSQLASGLAEEQKMVLMGGYLVCFPSSYYHNILNIGGDNAQGKVSGYFAYDETFECLTKVNFTPCDEDGNTVPSTKPESPESGDLWNDNGTVVYWSASTNTWVETLTYYTLMSGDNTGLTSANLTSIKEGDIVEIYTGAGNRKQTFTYVKVHPSDLTSEYKRIILKGYPLYGSYATVSTVHICHRIPDFNYVFEHNNRIWGCYYGTDADGNVINEIYASALGDFRNFYKYEGVSTDAWTATIGAPGEWTGACKYGTYPTFFKENAIIRVYGEYPSTYGTYTYNYRGVKKGNAESLAIVNEVLYYNTTNGIVGYSGGLPVNIDANLHETFENVIGGSYKGKYYACCTRMDGSISVFVYDTVRRMWIKEDDLSVKHYISSSKDMFMITEATLMTAEGNDETELEWSFETAMLGLGYANYKYTSRIQARIKGDGGCTAYVAYDGGEWEQVGHYGCSGITPILVNLNSCRCDYFSIRFEGCGRAKILSLSYLVEMGSENIEN